MPYYTGNLKHVSTNNYEVTQKIQNTFYYHRRYKNYIIMMTCEYTCIA